MGHKPCVRAGIANEEGGRRRQGMQSRLGEADHRRDDQETRSGEGRIPCHASPSRKKDSGDKNKEPVVAGPTTRRASRVRAEMSGAGFGRNVSWMGSDEGSDRDWIAQSGEHKTVNLGVAGSIPAPIATPAESCASKAGRRREEFKGRPETHAGCVLHRADGSATRGPAAIGYRCARPTAADQDQNCPAGTIPVASRPAAQLKKRSAPRA